MTKRLAYTKAQRDAFARLARPPYKLDHFGMIAEQMTASLAKMEAMKTESWKELWRLTLEEHGEDALPRPGDFYLRFHLEAAKDDAHARKIPMADGSPDILVEPFPCLTEDHVLWAGVSKGPGWPHLAGHHHADQGRHEDLPGSDPRIDRQACRDHDRRQGGDGPRHPHCDSGGKAMISGNFSREEAEAIAEKLNSFRKKAEELFDEFEKESGSRRRRRGSSEIESPGGRQPDRAGIAGGLRHKHPELARFGEALRHEVDVRNGGILVSLAYEHNYHSGTKGKPAGPKEAKQSMVPHRPRHRPGQCAPMAAETRRG